MDVLYAEQLTRTLMQAHGLSEWSFRYNRRRRSLGLCRYAQKRIELSLPYVMRNEEVSIRDTILHEIAHALAGQRSGHGAKWKAICRQIGALPERCDRSAVMPRGRWVGRCGCCGQEFSRYRRPLKRANYSCRKCGPEEGAISFYMEISQAA